MAFASLTIDLNARLANIEKDLGRSVQMAERSAQRMQAAFSGIGKAFAGLGAGLAVGQFLGVMRGLIDSADGLNDLATRTGTSVKALASLQLAATLADTDLENLGKGMGKLSIFMAQNAEEAAALGITARDPAEAFAQLADVIGATADPAERNALAMRVLGKSYEELMPLLAQGGDALRKQSKDSEEYASRMEKLAEGAAKFNDTLDELKQTGQNALLPLAQAFTDFAGAALQAAEGVEGFDKVLAGLGQAGVVGQTIAVLWANVAYVFKGVGTEIGGIAAQLAAIATGDFKGAGAISDAMKADAEAARKELDRLEDRILNFRAAASKEAPKIKGASGPAVSVNDIINPGEAEKIQDALRKAFDLKPLDDYISGFGKRRQDVEKEYAKLVAKLTGPQITGAKGFDIAGEVSRGQSALARGDVAGQEVAVERARQMLEGLKDNGGLDSEVRYYADLIKRLELAMVDSQQATAETTRDAMLKNLNEAARAIESMEPIAIPLGTDAIANDIKATLEQVRRDLEANPIQVPVVATRARGIYRDDVAGAMRSAALQTGGRV